MHEDPFIQKLRDILERHLGDENFGVTELAREVGLSRSQLHRRLKAINGKSTSLFIREYRLSRALEMLEGNVATVSEIAYKAGFRSPTYFNSSFKKLYGYPPGEVKRRKSDTEAPAQEAEVSHTQNKAYGKSGKVSKRNVFLVAAVLVLALAATIIFTLNNNNKSTPDTTISTNQDKSIAVLPFKNYSGDPSLDPFCDGMTDEVISRLTKIKSISKVISRTSVFNYKDTDKSMPEIAAELNVTHILEGNFQKSGDKIKVNLQLINAPQDDHFWSDEYSGEWDSNDIFNIQAAVAENVAKHMDVEVSEEESRNIQKRPTENKEAYRNYLLAQFQRNKDNEQAYANAIPLYENAIKLDSGFIEPYIGLADVWIFGGLVWGIYPEQEAWANAKKVLEKARDIDENYAGLKDMLYTGYFYYDWDFVGVESYFQYRLENNVFDRTPSIDADFSIKTGRYEEAIINIDKSIAQDPSVGIFDTFKGMALLLAGEKDQAVALMEKNLPLHSDNWWYLRESAKLLYYLGEYAKSKEQLIKIKQNFPDYPPILMWFNAIYAHMDGKAEETKMYMQELENAYQQGSSGSPAWFLALYYCSIQDYDQTFSWLQKSYENHEVEMTWLKEEPLLQPLKNDPRYIELYNRVGFSKFDEHLATK
ncbi:MAG: helix-turn-helix domain-containing protein [Eudoraea sp.]|nr:helix-turn-helix domain-containing protein [Eudoraea sp.]